MQIILDLIVNKDAVFDDYFPCAICETASAMAPMLAPEVRSQFAKRLKTMRTQRGFDRARYFARSLGIEENRYTRYERAEVEPSLTLIHKMCETLRVSPNELLGFAELETGALLRAGTGSRRGRGRRDRPTRTARGRRQRARTPSARSPGSLAAEAVAIRHEQAGKSKAAGDRWRRCARPARSFAACRRSLRHGGRARRRSGAEARRRQARGLRSPGSSGPSPTTSARHGRHGHASR